MNVKTLRKVIIVAGEQSGDILGAGLIQQLKILAPDCEFAGIGGPRMIDEGFVSYFPMDRLSVMGFVEPLKRLPELLNIRASIKQRLRDDTPDIFIGIDSPDFNLNIELAAKALNIFSVHYVSPSVWAWRQGRIKKIKKCVDLMLTLFPFEEEFYKENNIPVRFVGHPLADTFPIKPDALAARQSLKLSEGNTLCALMPGSRKFEVDFLLPLMLSAAEQLKVRYPNIQFVLPAANTERLAQVKAVINVDQTKYVHILDGQSHTAMTAADFVIMASGTTTLEAMLLKRPMIITYKWPSLTWKLLSRLVKIPYVGLPNLLANKALVPELLQGAATTENIVKHACPLIEKQHVETTTIEYFIKLHALLKKNASETAAQAIHSAWIKRTDGVPR